MSAESLKRVLLGIKGEAKNMKKERLGNRLKTEKQYDITPENTPRMGDGDMKDDGDPQDAADQNDVALGVVASDKMEEADEDSTIEQIRKLLARV